MHRYIALAWNPADPQFAEAARVLNGRAKVALPDWQRVLSSTGIDVYHSKQSQASRVYRLSRNRGVILGTLFAANGASRAPSSITFDDRASGILCRTDAVALVENYWGRYVGFIKPADGIGVWVVRDPTAAFPCFGTEFNGIDIIFSNIDNAAALGLIEGRINWDHISSYLWFDQMITSHTGLEGVYQVQAGERILVGASKAASHYIWNPVDVYGRRTIEDRHAAGRELGSAIRNSVEAWASCFDNLLLELSGGLDSAVVLSCLTSMSNAPSLVCENHFSRDMGGDERHFARKAASSVAIELIETPIVPSGRPIQSMFDTSKVASPTMMTLIPDTHWQREEIVDRRSIDAVFSGQGGDHLFQSIKTRQIAAEYAFRHGFSRDLLRVIADTSRLTRRSLWSVLAAVVVSGFLHRPPDPYGGLKPSSLLADLDCLNADLIRHPWIEFARSLPGSKRRQIFDIVDTQTFQRPSKTRADVVHPLISQPIIEICLQIPSYILAYDGKDRALVREIFRASLPADILNRTTKGATTGYFNNVLVSSASSLREFLLDGLLVAGGLLDKAKVGAALSDASLIRGADLLFPILDAIRAEIWLRNWSLPDRRTVS